MKKLYLPLFMSLFLVNLVSATNPCGNDNSYLGTFKQGGIINLKQTCDDCSYVNLSNVSYPNSSFALLGQFNMTKSGTDASNECRVRCLKGGCFKH